MHHHICNHLYPAYIYISHRIASSHTYPYQGEALHNFSHYFLKAAELMAGQMYMATGILDIISPGAAPSPRG